MLHTEALLICPLEEVAMHAGSKELMEVDANSWQVVGDPHGTMVQQVRPHPIYSLKYVLITYLIIKN
jgi:hypothetical protein